MWVISSLTIDLPDFLTDAVVIGMHFLSHPVVAILCCKVDYLLKFHITNCFQLHLLVVHYDFPV